MKCSFCGTEFNGNFCPNCGKPAQNTVQERICSACGNRFTGNFCPVCGKPAIFQGQTYVNSTTAVAVVDTKNAEESRFTGGAFANFFIGLLTILITLITLTLAYPAMSCWKMRWEARHTYIRGRRLVFDGKARQLFGRYLLWLFLSIITLGLFYVFRMKVSLKKWQTKHTHIYGNEQGQSEFTGSALGLFVTNLICRFVTIITLSFGAYWAKCHKERWFAKHTVIDVLKVEFDGKAIQYFGKIVLWTFLTIITIGIYCFWLIVKSKQWIAKHTVFAAGQALPPIVIPTETHGEKKSNAGGHVAVSLTAVSFIVAIVGICTGWFSMEGFGNLTFGELEELFFPDPFQLVLDDLYSEFNSIHTAAIITVVLTAIITAETALCCIPKLKALKYFLLITSVPCIIVSIVTIALSTNFNPPAAGMWLTTIGGIFCGICGIIYSSVKIAHRRK